MRHVPEIKLIRTDTTLDLSQKAEKVWLPLVALPGTCLGPQGFGHGFGPVWNHHLDLGQKKTKAVVQTGPTGRKKKNTNESKCAGWISCDRCNKASLHITIPGMEFKSSTNDPRKFKSSVAVRTAKVRMVLARRLSELQPMRTPKTSRVLVRFPA